MTDVMEFKFLDPQVLAQLAALLIIWVQWSKDFVPENLTKQYSLACSLVFTYMVDLGLKGNLYSKLALTALVAASITGLGYKVLTSPKVEEKTITILPTTPVQSSPTKA